MKKHLREVCFELGLVDLPRTSPAGPFTDEARPLVDQIVTAIRRFSVLSAFIEIELRKVKASVGEPPASMAWIAIESGAKPNPVRATPPMEAIEVTLPYSPLDLPNIPTDREALARFQLKIAREAARYFSTLDGFPSEAWEKGCAKFEQNGFSIWMKAGERLIPGTRLKGQVAVEVAPDTTTRWLILSHRGDTLARVALHKRSDGPDFATSKFFRGFMLEGSILTLGTDPFAIEVPGRPPVWPAEQIDLKDHSDVFALAVEKGWVAN